MNFNRRKFSVPEDAFRPRKVVTRTSEEYFAVLTRADDLKIVNGGHEVVQRGDYRVTAVNPFGPGTGNGGRNGHYEFELAWHAREENACLPFGKGF